MSQLERLSPKEKAQTGMFLIKRAIGQMLTENGTRWLGQKQIEEDLGLSSECGSSTCGAIALMFLDELIRDGDVVARQAVDGMTWHYQAAK